MNIFTVDGLLLLLRWVHFLAGITWIGLLYYFNFVQAPFVAEVEPDVRSVVTRKLVPRALAWFRYAALVTFLAGLTIILVRWAQGLPGTSYWTSILSGGVLGTIMFANVWGVIWPNQKVVIASAEAAAGGGQADPRATDAARRAMLASRTNVALSVPMLFFMGAASHFGLFGRLSGGALTTYWIVFALIVGAVEANSLVGLTGPAKKPLETIGNVLLSGLGLFVVLYILALLVA